MTGGASRLETAAQTRRRRIVNAVIAAALILLVIVGLLTFQQRQRDSESTGRADALHARLIEAGLPTPGAAAIRDALGRDGGLICQDPSSPLIEARYRSAVANGAGGPGSRPVIADRDVVTATALAIETYCPDHLPAYLRQVNDWKLGDTTK
ncbi:hypothetical protein [Nocardia blacklockiae]|uniref:hypothetical protein n=1 Tax=Nocardia blacklockiae TaxID=480036 RepID=UPI0018939BA3|nr:hypothetical protein [Nocardia blacklockiae]MBF6173039.1 hypothetical protein [Nocardia blacklockiae]